MLALLLVSSAPPPATRVPPSGLPPGFGGRRFWSEGLYAVRATSGEAAIAEVGGVEGSVEVTAAEVWPHSEPAWPDAVVSTEQV